MNAEEFTSSSESPGRKLSDMSGAMPRVLKHKRNPLERDASGASIEKGTMKKKVSIPKLKQKMVLQKMQEKAGRGEPVTMKEAMIESGYSPEYARAGNIKKTKTWTELMDEFLPEAEIAEHHKRLLNAREVNYFVFPKKLDDEICREMVENAGFEVINIKDAQIGKMVFYSIENARAKKDALDMFYKLKSKYDNTIHLKGKLSGLSDAEIAERVAGIVSGTLGAIAGARAKSRK